MKHKIYKGGFSLMELLIYITVVTALTMSITAIIVYLTQGQSRSEARAEANANMRFALDKINADITAASDVATPGIVGATTTTLVMTISGTTVTYCVATAGSVQALFRAAGGGCSATSEQITAPTVNVGSIAFVRVENNNPVLGKTAVTIRTTLALSTNTGTPSAFTFTKQTAATLQNPPLNAGITSGLIGWWKLDDGSGTTAADSSGLGNNGTLTNGPVWTTGIINSALSFDGVDDYVSISNESNFDFERIQPFSISAWFYRRTNTTEDDIFEKTLNVPGFQGYALWLPYQSGNFFACTNCVEFDAVNTIGACNNNIAIQTPANSISLNSWVHVAVTYDGTSKAAGVNIYLNGVSQPLAVLCDTLNATILNNNNPLIGTDTPAAGTSTMDGLIDDVRIYNRALSAADVQNLYAYR